MKRKILIGTVLIMCIGLGLSTQKASAQVDPHFSQYYAYPMWLNPGLTGVIDGDFRITANYKRQWASIANPYSTAALSFDTYPFNNLGFGFTILNQSAGDVGWKHLNALFSTAYRLILDNAQMNVLSIGIQAGIVNEHFDPAKAQTGSQWDPVDGYDPTAPTGEVFAETSALDFDANVGIVYFNRNPNVKMNPFGGISLYHLSRPKRPFIKGSKARLPMRLNVHGGVKIKLSPRFSLTPQFIYLQQGNASEKVVSLYGQTKLSTYSDFLFGATYRMEDALMPFVGFHLGDFTLGLSYDVNVSHLEVASENKGGIELSLSYTRHKRIRNPRFVCPRM